MTVIENPCKDCITYAICKGQMESYLDYKDWKNNQTQVIVSFMQTIDRKCPKPAEYMRFKRDRDKDISTTVLIYKTICEIFGGN